MNKWTMFTAKDALQEREPIAYAIEGVFALPSLNVVYGAPNCLKSLLMQDAIVCVASGQPWLEPLFGDIPARPVLPLPVLWLDFDNGPIRTHERLGALLRARKIGADEIPLYYVSMPAPWLDGNDAASIISLIELANDCEAGLIVIDNLGTVCGGTDENSSGMIQILSNFRQVAERTEAAVVLIHHQRKSSGFKGRKGETLRGHSSIEAALDLALLVERDPHEDTVIVQSTKTRGPDVSPFGAMFTYEHVPDSSDLFKTRFFGIAVEDDRKLPRAKQAIFDALADPNLDPGKTQLLNRAQELSDLGVNYLRGVITRLVTAGEIVETIGAKNLKHYARK